jgi:hypothetical protein
MDMNRVLGALLGGAAQPPRRRRRTTQPAFGGSRGGNAQLGRALAALAGVAIEAMTRGSNAPSAPPPAPSHGGTGRAPSPLRMPAPAAPQREAPRMPSTGSSPWGTKPASSGPLQPEPAYEGTPEGPSAEEAEALLLVRAMVAAAQADGAIDAAERRAIAAQLDAAGLTAEERDFVLADFDRPLTVEALAREATDPMLRARLYAAAVAGAGSLTPAERAWLDALAKALRMDKAAAAAIEARLGA